MMYGNNPAPPPKKMGNLTTRKVGILLHKLSNDEDDDEPSDIGDVTGSQHVPWHSGFHGYLNSRDQIGAMTIVEWWGVRTQNECPTYADLLWLQWNTSRYPVWASLAQDYLPVMASSVSSERAFSSTGITISKRHSRLKSDIVEALQFIKCIYCRELLFREELSTALEAEESFEDLDDTVRGMEDKKGWDGLVGDLQDDKGFQDVDGDNVFVQTIRVFQTCH